jgi:hypothetical protein
MFDISALTFAIPPPVIEIPLMRLPQAKKKEYVPEMYVSLAIPF